MDGSVSLDISNKIATVTFSHPKANSCTSIMLQRLADEINRLSKENCNVVVLQSAGEGAFCAGASFEEINQISSLPEATEYFSGFARLILALRNCDRIILARAHGKAVGGGLVSSLHATIHMRFKPPLLS